MKLKGVLFDLDGTIVELNLNFDRLREELNIKERFILEAIYRLNGDDKRKALNRLKEIEIESATNSVLMPGVKDVFEFLKDNKIKTGIVTRNCREAVDIILQKHGLDVGCVITREDAPPKPSPEPIRFALKKLSLAPQNSIYVGDFLFDILAGKNAGVKTVLILNERNREFKELADISVHSMEELIGVIERMLNSDS